MDGVSAFVNGLHWAINGLVLGIAGIIVMSVSVAIYFSFRPVKRAVPVLAVIGSVLLLPAIYIFSIGSLTSNIGIFVGIIVFALTALILFYDITVIRKFIKLKKK